MPMYVFLDLIPFMEVAAAVSCYYFQCNFLEIVIGACLKIHIIIIL